MMADIVFAEETKRNFIHDAYLITLYGGGGSHDKRSQ